MTVQRTPDTLIRAFLDDGQEELSERAYDAVRRDIHGTRQRVVLGPWKEPSMTSMTRLAIGAGVLVAVGVAWINIGPGANFGSTPTPSPTASPQLVTGPNRELQPGQYTFEYPSVPGSVGPPPGTRISITVPAPGWTNYADFAVDRNYGPTDAEAGPSFVVWNITNRYVDGCADRTPLEPAPGPGIDELLETLADQPAIDAGPLVDVTVDGYAGKSVDLTVAVDIATCQEGFFPWLDKFVQGNDELLRVYALDVDGERLTFFLRLPSRTTPADRALLDSIVDSVDIEP